MMCWMVFLCRVKDVYLPSSITCSPNSITMCSKLCTPAAAAAAAR